ncbi:hypothetical protein ABK040_003715 [Willaertia magna]
MSKLIQRELEEVKKEEPKRQTEEGIEEEGTQEDELQKQFQDELKKNLELDKNTPKKLILYWTGAILSLLFSIYLFCVSIYGFITHDKVIDSLDDIDKHLGSSFHLAFYIMNILNTVCFVLLFIGSICGLIAAFHYKLSSGNRFYFSLLWFVLCLISVLLYVFKAIIHCVSVVRLHKMAVSYHLEFPVMEVISVAVVIGLLLFCGFPFVVCSGSLCKRLHNLKTAEEKKQPVI